MTTKAKKKSKDEVVEAPKQPKKGFDIKVKLTKSGKRLKTTVTLLEDGVEIASDYDFVNI